MGFQTRGIRVGSTIGPSERREFSIPRDFQVPGHVAVPRLSDAIFILPFISTDLKVRGYSPSASRLSDAIESFFLFPCFFKPRENYKSLNERRLKDGKVNSRGFLNPWFVKGAYN